MKTEIKDNFIYEINIDNNISFRCMFRLLSLSIDDCLKIFKKKKNNFLIKDIHYRNIKSFRIINNSIKKSFYLYLTLTRMCVLLNKKFNINIFNFLSISSLSLYIFK